jgi:hypothetical protein
LARLVTSRKLASVATVRHALPTRRCRRTNALPRGASTDGSPPRQMNVERPSRATRSAGWLTTVPAPGVSRCGVPAVVPRPSGGGSGALGASPPSSSARLSCWATPRKRWPCWRPNRVNEPS